jgi:hypothetical protein
MSIFAKVALVAPCAFGTLLLLRSAARAQPPAPKDNTPTDVAPAETPPANPAETPPTKAPPPSSSEEAPPAEFPCVVQGGVVAAAPPSSTRPWPTQRNFALFAAGGSYHGLGLGIRTGWARVGLDTSFAFFPILATYSPNPETFPDFELLLTFQATGSIYVGLYRPDPRTTLGISFGYKYNSLLRHGATVAFYLQRELSAHWTLQGFVGPAIFPDAEDQIRQKMDWRGGSVLSGMAWHQAGLGASLAFFP